MAITVTTTPAANVAAFAPVLIAGTTDRNPFTGGVRQQKTLTLIDNNSGFVRLTMSSTSGLLVEDTILIDGATLTMAQYNGRHEISAVTATTVTLTTVWATATTGAYGTLYRMNDNLYIKCTVKNDSAVVIGTIYSFVNTSTAGFSIDISKLLQYELGSIFDLATTGEKSTALASHDYDINLYESWQAYDYSINEFTHGTTYGSIAHRATVLSATANLTNNFYFDTKLFVHAFIVGYVTDVNINDYYFSFVTSLGATYNTNGLFTLTNGHFAYTYQPATGNKWVRVQIVNEITEIVHATIYVHHIGCASTILYYLNRYGGYEGYEFTQWERDQMSTKVDKYTGEAWEEKILKGKEYGKEANKNIRDIITSPEVYDENLTLVRVLSDTLNYRGEEVSPSVVVRYDETFIQ